MSNKSPWVMSPEIYEYNPVTDKTLEGAEGAGMFPKRIYLSPKVRAWRRTAVLEWFEDPAAWAQRHRSDAAA